jgi:lipoprotein signal peptidase
MNDCGDGCGAKAVEAANTPAYVRTLWLVVAMNAAMFVIGVFVTATGGSVSVRSDLLDFLGDSVATGIGLLLVGRSASVRSMASLWQGLALGALGLFALGSAVLKAFGGTAPEPYGMGFYGVLGLGVNLSAALLLLRHRKGDASVRAVWLYSRNDAVGNVAIMAAAGLVALTATRWPDVVVGLGIAALFLHSAFEIVREARRELPTLRLAAWFWPLGAILAVVALDQGTKALARFHLTEGAPMKLAPFLDLNLGSNQGIVFGILGTAEWGPWPLIGVTGLISAGLAYWLLRETRTLARFGLALLIGGAVGNLLDRLNRGTVTDFLDFHAGSHHWPAFNIADSAIMIGAALLLLDVARAPRRAA